MQLNSNGKRATYKIVAVNKNNDFKRAYRRGKSYVNSVLVTYVNKNRGFGLRVGITASKKVGNAVKRNRARRVIRAGLRELLPKLDKNRNIDLILVARTKTPFVKMNVVKRALEKQLKEAGLIR